MEDAGEIISPSRVSDDDSQSSREFEKGLGWLESLFEDLDASLVSTEKEAEMEGFLNSVTEQILWNILMRLPIGDQCRCRAVCSRWDVLLSTSSARERGNHVESNTFCSILFDRRDFRSKFFSHAEDRWYEMPLRPTSCLDLKWKLRATDKGLVCYQAYTGDVSWLLVCNPINQSFQVVPPKYRTKGNTDDPLKVVKFTVDPEAELFKARFKVVLLHEGGTLIIFDSKTQRWKSFERVYNSAPEGSQLLWKSMIYKDCSNRTGYLVFDVKSRKWKMMKTYLPGEGQKEYCIMRSKMDVMLVQFYPMQEDPIRIWVLLDAKEATISSPLRWEKVEIEVPEAMEELVGEIDQCWSHGREFICFATCRTNRWIEYTFSTKRWRVMPCSAGKLCSRSSSPLWGQCPIWYKWLGWEPCPNLHVKEVRFKESDYPQLAAFRKERDMNNFSDSDQAEDTDWDYDDDGDHHMEWSSRRSRSTSSRFLTF